MATVMERIPVDRINAEAREIHFARTMLTLIAAVLFGIGWLAGKVFTVLWASLAWSAAAVKVGWQDARKPGGG